MNKNNHVTNKKYLLFISVSAALGGFLFGYDTAVISGTISLVKSKFALDAVLEGWFVSSALVGCLIGVIISGEISDRIGRKKALISTGLLFSISAVGCAISGSHTELIIYRVIGGIGVGMASIVSPLYISEVSPAKIRGSMVSLYQFAITLGILCAYFANAYLLDSSSNSDSISGTGIWHKIFVLEVWRGMFGSESIPAILFAIIMFFVPLSPRWLASKGRNEEAGKVLERINNRDIADKELESIKKAIASESEGSWRLLLKKGIRLAVLSGMGLGILSQFTGINAIVYYGPRIMEEAGIKLSDALGGQVIIGFVIVISTIYSIVKIDKFGRKKLMKGGITGMFISLIIVGILFFLGITQGTILLIFIITYVVSFSIGYGTVIWVMLSEIYPTKIRGRAMSVATLALWTGTAIIGQVVPWMLENLTPAGTFFVFAAFCIPVPFILRRFPETKGLSLEEIEKIW
jgi:SP family arabinose:H+ symporter-like MFS transporter